MAKLVADKRELLCVIRDVSEGGIRLRLFHELPQPTYLAIEMENGESHALQLVWQADEEIGCSFVHHGDLRELLSSDRSRYVARQPRLEVFHEATLTSGGVHATIIVRNISEIGLAIDSPQWLMIRDEVRIESPLLPTMLARVAWRRPPRYGLVLEKKFEIPELARICLEM